MIDFLNYHLVPGIVLGCIYALGAIGVSLTFGILRFANFAHGPTMTLGAYLTLDLTRLTGWHPLAVMPGSMAVTAGVTLLLDRLFFRPLRASDTVILVMASFGLMLMLTSAIQLAWGVQVQALVTGIQRPAVLFDTLRIAPKHLLIIATAIVLMGLVHWVLTYTRTGKAMRAVSDSPELASLTGIDTETVVRATWIVGAALAAAAGTCLAIDSHVETQMGFKMMLPVFAAAIVGGIGRPYGAMVGGLLIGITEELSTYAWFGTAPLLSPGYKAGVAFAIMVAMLILRPSGIFRGRVF